MPGFEAYILKVALCLTTIYFLYWLLLRRITFFNVNRACLLLGLLGSFVIPLLTIKRLTSLYDFLPLSTEPGGGSMAMDYHLAGEDVVTQSKMNFKLLIALIYRSGLVFMGLKFLTTLSRMILIVKRAKPTASRFLKVSATFPHPFTFFNIILIPEGSVHSLILEHEIIHRRQWHWLDLALAELCVVVLWFNPMTYFYGNAIRLQQEYLADEAVIKSGASTQQYLECLWAHLNQKNPLIPLVSTFSQSIKSRIHMMTQQRSSTLSTLRYLLLIPLTALLVFGFSTRATPQDSREATPGTELVQEDRPSGLPVDISKLTAEESGYGMRMNPYLKKKMFHTGIDFTLPAGEKAMATADGVVVKAIDDPKMGNQVVIKHGEVYTTSYAHLQRMVVSEGTKVSKGEIIGYVGSTGWSTGPHLHYEVLKNGENVDPAEYLPKKK
jgi:bla regulator protein blaR1